MLGVVLANKFDAKVIDYKCEGYWAPHVLPQPFYELALVVAGLSNSFCEQVVGYLACNWNSIRSTDNF